MSANFDHQSNLGKLKTLKYSRAATTHNGILDIRLLIPILTLFLVGSCQNYDTFEFRQQSISRETFEAKKRWHAQVPSDVSLECVMDTAVYLSPLTSPQVGLGEGGYGVSQSGLATKAERTGQAWRLGLNFCGEIQNRRTIPKLEQVDGWICRTNLVSKPCLPWPMKEGAEVRSAR